MAYNFVNYIYSLPNSSIERNKKKMNLDDLERLLENFSNTLAEGVIYEQIIEMQKHKIISIDFALSLMSKTKLIAHMKAVTKIKTRMYLSMGNDFETVVKIVQDELKILISGFCIGYDYKTKEIIEK